VLAVEQSGGPKRTSANFRSLHKNELARELEALAQAKEDF
jgi:hypothetical protein